MDRFPDQFTKESLVDHAKTVMVAAATEEAAKIRAKIMDITSTETFYAQGCKASIYSAFKGHSNDAKKIVLLELMRLFPKCITRTRWDSVEYIEKAPSFWIFDDIWIDLNAQIEFEGLGSDGKFKPM